MSELIPESIYHAYQKTRTKAARHRLCHAPFQNMYFGRDGRITSCCYNRTDLLGTFPEQSLNEIWYSAQAKAFREQFSENTLARSCQSCRQQLIAGNFSGLQARSFDRFSGSPKQQLFERISYLALRPGLWMTYWRKILFAGNRQRLLTRWQQQSTPRSPSNAAPDPMPPFPRSLEFELSTICNLECVMCFGEFSSSIRKNREQLPPLPEPYQHQDFLTQITPFIQSAMEAKFYGGEPFLIPLYFELWERFMDWNPGAMLSITTNATIFNQKVKRVLHKLNVHLVISMDSFEQKTYEIIRKNARFDRVMQNLQAFDQLVRKRGQHLTLSICPMQINWREIPAIFHRANDQQWYVHVNTVWFPIEQSLRFLPAEKLQNMAHYFAENTPTQWQGPMAMDNASAYEGLINQILAWAEPTNDQYRTSINALT